MRTLAALALALAFATPSAFADTQCSDASGDVQYKHVGYNRGMPPQDGDVIGIVEIRLKGKVVSKSIAYKGKSPRLGLISPNFSEQVELKNESHNSGFTKDFSAKLTLAKEASYPGDGKGIELPISAFVICQENFFAIP